MTKLGLLILLVVLILFDSSWSFRMMKTTTISTTKVLPSPSVPLLGISEPSSSSFSRGKRSTLRMSTADDGGANDNGISSFGEDRRSWLGKVASWTLITSSVTTATMSAPVSAEENVKKIVVLGGSGYVGSYVLDEILSSKQEYQVVSVSRSTADAQSNKVKSILGKELTSNNLSYISLDVATDDLSGVLKDASVVISCIGAAPGSKNQRDGNGAVNVRLAKAAKAAGSVDRFVYIGVASDLANGPAKFLLGEYFKGKQEAESAILKEFGTTSSFLIKPAIIAGGPPGEIRPPGPPGVTPVSVEDVAKAVVAGAIGSWSGSLDGNSAISNR